MMNKRILVVDDDQEIFHAFQSVLSVEGVRPARQEMSKLMRRDLTPTSSQAKQGMRFDLQYASQGEDGFHLVEQSLANKSPFAVAFIDVRMPPGWDGIKTASQIRKIDPALEIVIVTAYSDRTQEEILEAVGNPSKLLLYKKPFDPDEILQLAISLTEKWNIAFEEKQTRAKLQASQERFRTLVETITDWVWEVDTKGNFTYCSPVCETIFDYHPEELVGKSYSVLLASEEHRFFQHHLEQCLLRRHGRHTIERVCLKKNSGGVHVESSFTPVLDAEGAIIGFRGIDRDITARKKEEEHQARMEEQFRHVQKLEALGSLAGGIAHDFNNILSPILGFSQLCLMEVDQQSNAYRYVQNIETSANRAADLVRQILGFARDSKKVYKLIDLNALVKDFSKMLGRLIPENIKLVLKPGQDLYPMKGDKCQVEQILLNLVVNARDAISPQNGEVVISTSHQDVAKEENLRNVGGQLILGEYTILTVKDNGSGIPPETISKIFDPFFTTKEVGKGTGIGLATIAGIVEQYQGHIRVETEEGKGTAFQIFFARATEQSGMDEDREELALVKGGSGVVLLAEDDATVRAVISSALYSFGYTVLEAKSGSEALETFKEQRSEIDLLLSDVIMPGCGGKELAQMIRKLDEDLPIIFISGYPVDLLPKDVSTIDNSLFLPKPCSPDEIAMKIRELLGKKVQNS